jgi:hypothetical protein
MTFSIRTFRILTLAFCVAAALLAATGIAKADIVANGSFSTGDLTSWTATPPPPGGGTTPGIGITVITLGPPGPSTLFGDLVPDDGAINHAVYFVDDNANEMLSQTVTLAANTQYNLTFDLFGIVSGATNSNNFELVDSLGSVIASSCFANAPLAGCSSVAVGVWTPELLQFTTGAATSYTLDFAFTAGSTPAKDVALTNISIQAPAGTTTNAVTPEPSSIALLGTGLLAAAGALRRRLVK